MTLDDMFRSERFSTFLLDDCSSVEDINNFLYVTDI